MKPDGLGWLFAPGTVKDGPLPAHYEPVESPVGNLLYPGQPMQPDGADFEGPLNRLAHTPTAEYPVVATTFRLTEHYLSGPMSRFNSWLNELQPEMFVELSPELAAERGIVHGGWVTVRTAAGRSRPGRWSRGGCGRCGSTAGSSTRSACRSTGASPAKCVGDNANDLTSLVADPNVSMHEGKAFACQVHAGRRGGPRPRADEARRRPGRRASRVPDTPAAAQPEGRFEHGE